MNEFIYLTILFNLKKNNGKIKNTQGFTSLVNFITFNLTYIREE